MRPQVCRTRAICPVIQLLSSEKAAEYCTGQNLTEAEIYVDTREQSMHVSQSDRELKHDKKIPSRAPKFLTRSKTYNNLTARSQLLDQKPYLNACLYQRILCHTRRC